MPNASLRAKLATRSQVLTACVDLDGQVVAGAAARRRLRFRADITRGIDRVRTELDLCSVSGKGHDGEEAGGCENGT